MTDTELVEMDGKSDPAYLALDDFTQTYIETLFWSVSEAGGFGDICEESLSIVIAECEEFQVSNADALKEAYALCREDGNVWYKEASAGHDFFLTRNDHAGGFHDRDLGKHGERLQSAAVLWDRVDVRRNSEGKICINL